MYVPLRIFVCTLPDAQSSRRICRGGARTVATIAAEAAAIGARVVLYMTCVGQMEPPTTDSERRRQHLDTWYRTVAAQVNGWVVPAAHACADAKRADPLLPVRAQNRDVGNVQPSPWGFYLISSVFYGVLTQRSPLGVASRVVQPFPPGPEAPLLFDGMPRSDLLRSGCATPAARLPRAT